MTCKSTLTINPSGDWAATTTATDESGAALDLTGFSASIINASADIAGQVSASIPDEAAGEVRVSVEWDAAWPTTPGELGTFQLALDSGGDESATFPVRLCVVNVGDGNTGKFYDFAVDGVQATITAPTFVDGYDYLIRFVGLSHNGATHDFRVNGAAVVTGVPAGNILTGYMELIAPTLTSWPKTAKSEFRIAAPGSLVGVTPATAVGPPPAMGFLTFPNLAAALSSVAFTWSGGSFDAGSAYLYRRRNFMFG